MLVSWHSDWRFSVLFTPSVAALEPLKSSIAGSSCPERPAEKERLRSAEKTAHRKCCGEVGPTLPLCNYYPLFLSEKCKLKSTKGRMWGLLLPCSCSYATTISSCRIFLVAIPECGSNQVTMPCQSRCRTSTGHHLFEHPWCFLSHGGSPVVTMVVSILKWLSMTWMIWG